MIVLIGESASGKDSLLNLFVDRLHLNPIVSYTTRPMRSGEIDGYTYHYITENDFFKKLRYGFFIEHTKYRDWYYGIAKEDCKNEGVVIIEPRGFKQLQTKDNINTISFYIKVPERERLIRMALRGDEVGEICRRIIADRDTFKGIESKVDFIVENKDLNETFNTILNKLKEKGQNFENTSN